MIHAFLKRWRHGFYSLCLHRSHRLRLPCYRLQTYDHQCSKHNGTCFNVCRYAKPALDVRYDEVSEDGWRKAADWLEAYGEHELYLKQAALTRRMNASGLMKYPPRAHVESLDPWDLAKAQQDYPPPLRRPTGDES